MNTHLKNEKVSREFKSRLKGLTDGETIEVIIVIDKRFSEQRIRADLEKSGVDMKLPPDDNGRFTAEGTASALGSIVEFKWLKKMMENQPAYLIM